MATGPEPRRARWLDRLRRRPQSTLRGPPAAQVSGLGTRAARLPLAADWGWRPALWQGPVEGAGGSGLSSPSPLGDEITLFHDCPRQEVAARQCRNEAAPGAPFALRLEVSAFEGSFLSLALEMPAAAVEGLQRRHLLRLDLALEVERPLEIFARLNVRHGPNTEQVVRELVPEDGEVTAAFDLAYTGLNEKRVETAWLDLIFEGPEMNAVTLRDLILCRHPRAEV